jgi:hypothetical protein
VRRGFAVGLSHPTPAKDLLLPHNHPAQLGRLAATIHGRLNPYCNEAWHRIAILGHLRARYPRIALPIHRTGQLVPLGIRALSACLDDFGVESVGTRIDQ